jgi:tRNA pseudouridine38-40 synthase
MRYFIHLAYDGTGYCGWQVQPNGDTVQGKMNFALSRLLNERVASMGCGRTDTGVHATDFYMHFDTDKVIDERMVYRLNSILPSDITVYRIMLMHDKAHTRFDAQSRTYEYYTHFNKNPYLRHYSYQLHYREMDWDRAMEATLLVPGFGDYTSLCRPSEDFKTNLCQVTEARWDRVYRPARAGSGQDEFMRFTITSNRFLRGMVRIIVGALVQVGRGGMDIETFKTTVEAKGDFKFAISSPPQGLYLTRVKYPYIEPIF